MDTQSVTMDTILEDVEKAEKKVGELPSQKKVDELQTQRGKNLEPVEKALRNQQGYQDWYVDELAKMKPPAAPKLHDIPAAPQQKYRSTMEAVQGTGGDMMLLAAVASLFTRRPLTTALNSAAGMMEAYHQGDEKRLKLERENWKDNVEATLKQNQKELEQYKAIMENLHFSMQQKLGMLQGVAASTKNEIDLADIKNGNIDQLVKRKEDTLKIAERLTEKFEAANMRWGIMGHGTASQQEKRRMGVEAAKLIQQLEAGETIKYGGFDISPGEAQELATSPKPVQGWSAKQEAIIRLYKLAEVAAGAEVSGEKMPDEVHVGDQKGKYKKGKEYEKDGMIYMFDGEKMIPVRPSAPAAPAPGAGDLGAQTP